MITALTALVLMLAQQPTLSGRVLHAGLPVPGATVTATRDRRSIVTTSDENGAFAFAALDEIIEFLAPSRIQRGLDIVGESLLPDTVGLAIGVGRARG